MGGGLYSIYQMGKSQRDVLQFCPHFCCAALESYEFDQHSLVKIKFKMLII
jgi:hypothetical protein